MSKEASIRRKKENGIPVVRNSEYRLAKRSKSKSKKEFFLEFILFKARKYISFALSRKSTKRLPKEQQEEISQEAILKILELFESKRIKKKFWRTYIRTICFGKALDYKKLGQGFEDGYGWTRFENTNGDEEEISIDQTLSYHEKYTTYDVEKIEIKWDLLCKMASRDKWLECFLRQIRSDKLREIAPVIGLSVSRADQYINEFLERFDDPKDYDNPWVQQIAYGLGISKILGWPAAPVYLEGGAMVGEFLKPINLDELPIHPVMNQKQESYENQIEKFSIPPRLQELRNKYKVNKSEEVKETIPEHSQQAFDLH